MCSTVTLHNYNYLNHFYHNHSLLKQFQIAVIMLFHMRHL